MTLFGQIRECNRLTIKELSMKYSEKDMATLISEVETQFADYLTKSEKEETTLQKSETEIVAEDKVETSEEDTIEKAEFDYEEEDFVEMDKLYSSMGKAEAEAHYKSLKKTLFTEGEEKITKKEENVVEKSEKENDTIAKTEFTAVKKENEDLKKNVENLTVAMTKFLTGKAPKRKAITDIEYVAKSEEKEEDKQPEDVSKLNKNEISKRLTAKIRSNSLEKSDKDLINKYYLEDNTSFDSIKHLL